ncbi:hypothetical protein [Bacillus thuringiensis]|uniref:hypothetical protein n=1 Tax=Bacillus thuringiensis TaxID=1428 RepID=UPI000BFEA316|nr:hypothetical protein [Bacillus thuringiensis]PGW49199.1 hypothetical protein COE03_11565 [Bacillus thuringiensis]
MVNDSSFNTKTFMNFILEHYLFYIEQHCALLQKILSQLQPACCRNMYMVINKRLYESLGLFHGLFHHLNMKINEVQKEVNFNILINPQFVHTSKNIKDFLKYIYKYVQTYEFLEPHYYKRCKLLLQTLLNQILLNLDHIQKNISNIHASPPWVSPTAFNAWKRIKQ